MFLLCTLGQATSFLPPVFNIVHKDAAPIQVVGEMFTINFMLSPMNVTYCVN
jgi:hypothetical protein